MYKLNNNDISNFFVAGLNYKKADANMRGKFAINEEQYLKILSLAPQYGLSELLVVSTCNRTEIYGFAHNANILCELLCTQTQGNIETFRQFAYIKNDLQAIQHLFDVAAGLDSQILGDYEIVGQLKLAFKFSKEHQFVGAYMERLVNLVLKSSKSIKTNTVLSGGTVSVAFAAIQYLKEKVAAIKDKKILLIGTGKIGRNTCKNLIDYIGTTNITLINRTEFKAKDLAIELGVKYVSFSKLQQSINEADIVMVATNAEEPVVLAADVFNSSHKIIIDLSIPFNVEKSVKELPHIILVNVDELSLIKDATLYKREAEVPKALVIIQEHINEFLDWHSMRKHVPTLKAVKNKLYAMHDCNLYVNYTSRQNSSPVKQLTTDYNIQKVINGMAVKMRFQNRPGCNYIDAINEFIATGTN